MLFASGGRAAIFALTLASMGTVRAADSVIWEMTGFVQPGNVQPLADGSFMVVDKGHSEVAQYSATRPLGGARGFFYDGASQPDGAAVLPDGRILVCDTNGGRVMELDANLNVTWSFGSGNTACVDTDLWFPSELLELPNGDFLIADQSHNRLIEVDRAGNKLWQFGRSDCVGGPFPNALGQPFHVQVLTNGDYLVTEASNGSVLQLHPDPSSATIVWQYGVRGSPGSGTGQLSVPTHAWMLDSGNVLISDRQNDRIIEVAPAPVSGGTIVWSYGQLGVPGVTPGLLHFPYDARRTSLGTTVIADAANNRVLEISPLQLTWRLPTSPLYDGRCVGPVTLAMTDPYGVSQPPADDPLPTVVPSGLAVSLFADSACSTPWAASPLTATAPAENLYAIATQTGTVQLAATATGYAGATISLTFEPAPPLPPSAKRLDVAWACEAGVGNGPLGWLELAMLLCAARLLSRPPPRRGRQE